MSSLGTFVGGILVVLAAIVELLVLGMVRLVRARLARDRSGGARR